VKQAGKNTKHRHKFIFERSEHAASATQVIKQGNTCRFEAFMRTMIDLYFIQAHVLLHWKSKEYCFFLKSFPLKGFKLIFLSVESAIN